MWEEWELLSLLQEYLKITLFWHPWFIFLIDYFAICFTSICNTNLFVQLGNHILLGVCLHYLSSLCQEFCNSISTFCCFKSPQPNNWNVEKKKKKILIHYFPIWKLQISYFYFLFKLQGISIYLFCEKLSLVRPVCWYWSLRFGFMYSTKL